VINVSPHLGGELHVAAYHTWVAVSKGLVERNLFAEAEGLPLYGLEDLV